MVLWAGLQCLIMVFSDHTHFLALEYKHKIVLPLYS